ncbi:hypothetical protein D9757_003211 [Collybiopsis confluens]|uniref:Uncharacterized protein n=1 Tax=Collybiopsis confluens TaxID=2823264 RepID=A0A8H5HZ10_9AGAR|nr:hypothetical protein D9757_003211 [Collybiopsis confluens]
MFSLSTAGASYPHLPSSSSLSIPDLSLLRPFHHLNQSSFSSSARQQAFAETPAQRRARVAFVHKQKQSPGEERVENWVREQARQSTFVIVAAAKKMSSPADKAKARGHKRNSSVHRPEVLPRKGVSDELLLRRTMLKDSSNLPSISEGVEEEEEPFVFYSTPLPPPPTYHISSKTTSHSPTRPSHQRRLSDLAVIPEGLEE